MKMPLFGRTEKRSQFDNPSIPISSDSIISLLGTGLATDSGIHVSEFNAMRLGAVWRCVSLLSGIIAGLPLVAYNGKRDTPGPKTVVQDSPIYLPPTGLTMFEFKEQIMVHLLLWGNSFIRKVMTNAGDTVASLILYRPWEVRVDRPKGPGSPKRYFVNNGDQNLTDDDIIHIPGLAYDGIKGLSPIAFARQSIGLGVAVEEYGAKFFGNGAMLGGIIKSVDRIPQEKAEQIKNRWRDKMTGLARAHEVAVLDSGLDFMPLTMPPEAAQFLATRLFSVNEIARWYGVPPHLIGDVDRTTSWGTGIAEQTLGFVRFTIAFWAGRIEQRMSMAIPETQYAEFDMNKLLRSDADKRATFYHNAISDGWMNRAQVREAESLEAAPPEAGLDQYVYSMQEQYATKEELATAVAAVKQSVAPPETPAPGVLGAVKAKAASGAVPAKRSAEFGDMPNITVNMPEMKAPVVNVHPAAVNVHPPEVRMDAPVVNVNVPKQPAPVVNVSAPVVTVNVPPKKPRTTRTSTAFNTNKDGLIIGKDEVSTETETG